MKTLSLLLLALALHLQPVYDPAARSWSFSGTVTDIRDVTLLGEPARVVQVADTWVVSRIGEVSLASSPLEVGDTVTVSISGAHVSESGVDWAQCEGDPEYCRLGKLLDAGLDSPDTDYPLSPSNELIHKGAAARHWRYGVLFWSIEPMQPDEDKEYLRLPAGMPALPDGTHIAGILCGRRTLVVVDQRPRAWLYIHDPHGWQVTDFSNGMSNFVLDTNEMTFARATWRAMRGLHDPDFFGSRSFSPDAAFE